MVESNTTQPETYLLQAIRFPESGPWQVEIFPGTFVRPLATRPMPNAFQRLMQRLVFGFRWERV